MRLLYSVTIIDPPRPVMPGRFNALPSEITGITLPRREISPSTPAGMLGALVMNGVLETSRTLNTLMPNVSPVPSENSRISMRLLPASLVRASTASSRVWSGLSIRFASWSV